VIWLEKDCEDVGRIGGLLLVVTRGEHWGGEGKMIGLAFLLLPLVIARPQVGYDIYSEEDLLALDSAPESVAVAVAPPPGFLAQLEREQGAGIGESVGVAAGGKKKKAGVGKGKKKAESQLQTALLPTPLPPVQNTKLAGSHKTIAYTNTRGGDGSYKFGYSTSGGTVREESGLSTPSGYRVTGSYQFRGTDGATYTVNFVADENGYRPTISRSLGRAGRVRGRVRGSRALAKRKGRRRVRRLQKEEQEKERSKVVKEKVLEERRRRRLKPQ